MIIVTGGAGFIGSNLVADLNSAGHDDIVIVDVLGNNAKWRNLAKSRFLDFVFPSELERFLARAPKGRAVFHMGANSSTTAMDADEVFETNFLASTRIWRWCASTRTPLVYASSAATYGDGSRGFDDDQSLEALDQLRPLNLYGWSKHAFDKWVVARAGCGEAPPQWVGLKFFNVYGPNELHKAEMKSLVAKRTPDVQEGGVISLFKSYRPEYADGEQKRDFIYVKDCIAVMLWLLDHPDVSGLFNVGTGEARSFRDLVMAIGSALGTTVSIQYVDMLADIRPNYQYFTRAKISKLREHGYDKPFWSLEAGVADYVRNYFLQGDPYR
ncbi:MAG: ADP-glyceromanno-heptose 6-epimerase [Pseudomonadota bacterium]|nr:ADP-glyceromanno-heptose 6-epimerase [Pseudomonadota bacterium]